MEKLIVKKVESLTTSTGNPYKKVDVQKTDGVVVSGVSAFKFKYPNLEGLIEGAEIEASIVIDGNYKNLVGAVEKPRGGASGAFKGAMIEKAQESKAQFIKEAQGNKELGIKVSSTIRMAVDIATSLTADQWHKTTMEEEIRFWREWLWLEWDKTSSTELPPF